MSFEKNRLFLIGAFVVGGMIGTLSTVALIYFDDVKVWFAMPRWSYPELASVKAQDCKISGLPADTITYAVSVERGDLLTDLVIGNRARRETKGIDVIVTRRDKPIVLILSAEISSIWNISIAKGARLAAVLVLGREAQGLVGIPKSVPHLVLATKSKPADCPNIRVSLVKEPRSPAFEELNSLTLLILGRRIDFLQSAGYGGRFFAGPRKQLDAIELLQSNEMDDDYLKASALMPPGRDGIDWLLHKGLIRPARREDIDAWTIGAATKGTLDALRGVGYRMSVERTFVILDKIELPDSLMRDGFYAFILPDGLPVPDYADEAAVFRMSDFTCISRFACRR